MTWPDPVTIAALAAATIAIIREIRSSKTETVKKLDEQTIQVEAAKTHAEDAAKVSKGNDEKLTDIKITAEKTASQTDGQLSNLRTDLAKALAEKDTYQHMLSETTTLLAAAQAAIASSKGIGTAPTMMTGGRRQSDKPVAVKIVEKDGPG